jgi:hypothetical protein
MSEVTRLKTTVALVLREPAWNWDERIKGRDLNDPKNARIKRIYEARRVFGLWDESDPAANAIVALVEAQNDVAMATEADALKEIADAPDMTEALTARAEAAVKLMRALLIETKAHWTPQGWAASD